MNEERHYYVAYASLHGVNIDFRFWLQLVLSLKGYTISEWNSRNMFSLCKLYLFISFPASERILKTRCDVSRCRQGILSCLVDVQVIIYCWWFSWKSLKGKTALIYEEQLAIHVCFKYFVSKTIFISVQVNKKANNGEVLETS